MSGVVLDCIDSLSLPSFLLSLEILLRTDPLGSIASRGWSVRPSMTNVDDKKVNDPVADKIKRNNASLMKKLVALLCKCVLS